MKNNLTEWPLPEDYSAVKELSSPEDFDSALDFFFENYIKRGMNLKELIGSLERNLLIRTLSHFEGNQKKTSEFLDMKPTTMCAKCKKYKIKFVKRAQ